MAKLDLSLFGRHSVRHIRQTEVAECGLACLAMIASFHGLDTDLNTLRRRHAPSLRGVSLKSLISVADQLGFANAAIGPLVRSSYRAGRLYRQALQARVDVVGA